MESLKEYKIIVADAGLRPAVLALLKENDLPVTDLDEKKTLFACINDQKVVGTGGLELLMIVPCFAVSVSGRTCREKDWEALLWVSSKRW
jgi:hypothetical protein